MNASLIAMILTFGQMPEPTVAATARLRVGERATATAIVVGRQKDFLYLLTADHALDGPDTTILRFEFFEAGSGSKPAFALKGATALLRRPVADLALLKVAVEPGRDVAILALVPPGKAPKRFPFEGSSVGCTRGDPPSAEAETVLGKRLAVRREDEVAFFWQAERAQARGRSGGPLLDAEGRVIGLGAATALGKGYYVHASELHAALKTEGFDWLWASPEVGKSGR